MSGAIRLDRATARALAHPLRMRLVGTLRLDGPATASQLAARLGVSSGLASYHLRQLAAAGFVVDDEAHAGSGRERWWRATHEMTSWSPSQVGDDPDAKATEQWLASYAARQVMEDLDGWLHRRPSADPAWVDASGTSDWRLTLSPAELLELSDEVDGVLRRWFEATKDRVPGTDGRARVTFVVAGFPDHPEPRR